MLFNDYVNISFDYTTSEPGGVRIFARPFSNGGLTPGYGAHGSLLYPTGAGSGTGYFTISSGNAIVDQIRFQMLNADQSQLLLEFFIPVLYPYSPHKITDIQFDPPPPAYLTSGHPVEIKFNYLANQPGGVRIFARPFSQGVLSSNYGAHGSLLYPDGSGSGDGFYEISDLSILVDQTRFRMTNEDQSVQLLEFFLDTPFYYGNQGITGLASDEPVEPRCFSLAQNYPNPFNPVTTIVYELAQSAGATVAIYDMQGRLVTTLVEGTMPAGVHSIIWDGCDRLNQPVASGTYICHFRAGTFQENRKMILLR